MKEVITRIKKTGYKLQNKHIKYLDECIDLDDDLIRVSSNFREFFKLSGEVSDDLIQQYRDL